MSVRVDTRPRNRNAPRPAEKDARGFLQWIRGRTCIFAAIGGCGGKIEAAHLDFAGGKGLGTKVADRFAIPVCSAHHSLQHRLGWATFMALGHVNEKDLLGAAGWLWAKWPGRAAWERKLKAR